MICQKDARRHHLVLSKGVHTQKHSLNIELWILAMESCHGGFSLTGSETPVLIMDCSY
jgi:hypothetical protein